MSTYLHYVQYKSVSHNNNTNSSSGTNQTSLNLTRIICLNNNFGLFLRIVNVTRVSTNDF